MLVEDVNGFFAAASSRERERPDANPQNAEDIIGLLGYEFTEGVRLLEYDVSNDWIRTRQHLPSRCPNQST